MEISISFSPILDLPFFLSFFRFLLVYWWWCPPFQLSSSNLPTFQTSRFFSLPVNSLLPCGCVVNPCCGSTRVVRPFSFFPSSRVRVRPRKKRGEGVSPSRGGRRDTAHAARPCGGHATEAAEPNGTERERGRRAEPKHPPTAPRDSLTHSLLVWGMETTPLRLRF